SNDRGLAEIRIGAKEFECIGQSPPQDHPHVFLEMGSQNEILCPYCSTLFRFDISLAALNTIRLKVCFVPDGVGSNGVGSSDVECGLREDTAANDLSRTQGLKRKTPSRLRS